MEDVTRRVSSGARSRLKLVKPPAEVYELKVTLRGSKPPIWRRVAVHSDIRLDMLHLVFQIVMGWTNSHLHQFIDSEGHCYSGSPEDDWGSALGMETRDTSRYRLHDLLHEPRQRLMYEYDFGDGWEHRVDLVKIHPQLQDAKGRIAGVSLPKNRLAQCLAGRLACPPEDCGGIWGYYHLLEVIQDPKHEEHDDLVQWLDEDFDPSAFDINEINEVLQDFE